MYIFYADESGFSKGSKLEPEQPITVFAGILLDRTKLFKAIKTFDSILASVNKNIENKIGELKFNDIKQGKFPYSKNFPKVDDKIKLLQKIIKEFEEEISFKVFYSAIDDKSFFEAKKGKQPFTDTLTHPYLAAAYRVISQIEHFQQSKKSNKGKTFMILDEQNNFQANIEELVTKPIHKAEFTQIIDTTYFGKSHYSKLIQIADLIAGILRYHLWCKHFKKENNHFISCIGEINELLQKITVSRECFKGDLKDLYSRIEIKSS